MASEQRCDNKYPENPEIRCRQDKGHSGNHTAEADVVDKNKSTWDRVKWEWNDKGIVQSPTEPAKYGEYEEYMDWLFNSALDCD